MVFYLFNFQFTPMKKIKQTIKQTKLKFAEKRKDLINNYIEKNGSAKGIKKDKGYQKTFSTQKGVETKIRNQNEKTYIKNNVVNDKGIVFDNKNLDLIERSGLFFDVLAPLGEDGDLFLDQYEDIDTDKVVAVIRDFDGNIEVIKDKNKLEIRLAELFRQAAALQSKTRVIKTVNGKRKKVTEVYPVVDVAKVQKGNVTYITVNCQYE